MRVGHLNATSLVAFQACFVVLAAAADSPSSNEELRELTRQHVTVLKQLATARMEELEFGKGDPLAAVDAVAELMDASLELAATPAERKSTVEAQLGAIRAMETSRFLKERLELAKDTERRVLELASKGFAEHQQVLDARARRLAIEFEAIRP